MRRVGELSSPGSRETSWDAIKFTPRDLAESQSASPSLIGLVAAMLYRATVKVLQFMHFYELRNERYASLVQPLMEHSTGRHLIVDLGCGRGGTMSNAEAGWVVLGVDKDRKALLEFLVSGVPRVQALADRLPLKARVADVVVAVSLVEHLSDQEEFFREIARILKLNGRALLQVPEMDFPIEPHTKWPFLRLLNPSFQAKVLAATGYEDLNLWTSIEGLRRMSSEAKLEIEQELPIWHFAAARLFPKPMGHILVLRRLE